MSDAPPGVGRLPDDAFAEGRRADQTRDQHEAFPEVPPHGAAASLPPTAWATPMRPSSSAAVHHVPSTHGAVRGRRVATLVVGLLMVVPLGLGITALASSSDERHGAQVVYGQGTADAWRSLGGAAVAAIQPHDGPLHELPTGPSRIRVEVVAFDETTTSLHLLAPEGNEMRVDLRLPAAFEVIADGGHGAVGAVVAPNDEQVEVQCRVYADGYLVSIATGAGLVRCLAEPAP